MEINEAYKHAMAVWNSLGSGHHETIYTQAMELELRYAGYMARSEVPIPVKHRTHVVGVGKADVVAYTPGCSPVIFELKQVAALNKPNMAQLRAYMRGLSAIYGYLVNFNPSTGEVDIQQAHS